MNKTNNITYVLGLDVGIASIGWSVVKLDETDKYLKPKFLVNCGVRVFPRCETPKTGESLAKVRREARSVRRRLSRRKERLKELKKLFLQEGLIANLTDIATINLTEKTPWQLRLKALDNKLTDCELARAIYHIAKRRGFKSNRKTERTEKGKGDYYKSLDENRELLKGKYRTVGEMFMLDERFKNKKRNSDQDFTALVYRSDLNKELHLILEKQQEFGNNKITSKLITKITEIINHQLPFMTSELMAKMIGKCRFYKNEERAAKSSITAEKNMLWEKINHSRLVKGYKEIPLTDEQRQLIYNLSFTKNKISYHHIRESLKLDESNHFRINYYKKDKLGVAYSDKDIEKQEVFIELKNYHKLRSLLKKSCSSLWQDMNTDHDLYDKLVDILTKNKSDSDIKAELQKLTYHITEDDTEILLEINFSKFAHLSLKALKQMLPELQKGLSYTEAVENTIPEEFRKQGGIKQGILPNIDPQEIRNPVVIRSLTQSRKVINAVIRQYGHPTLLHIELARDLAKNHSERSKIINKQKKNQENNIRIIKLLKDTFHLLNPKGFDILKYKLWKEQNEKCLYSQESIPATKLFADSNYTQVDHILPYSQSLNDRYTNKALVLTTENQRKRNETPYDYFKREKPKKWDDMVRWWESLKYLYSWKLKSLLIEKYEGTDAKEFHNRDLNDTRYISKFLKNFIEQNLKFKKLNINKRKRRVYTFNGQFTSLLRSRYGFNKDRDANNRHHALDATICAIATPSMIIKITKYQQGIETHKDVLDKKAKYFPEPWSYFRQDVNYCVFANDPQKEIKNHEVLLEFYGDRLKNVTPLFVSHMVRKKTTGAAHAETNYAIRELKGNNVLVVKKKLLNLTLPQIKKIKKDINDVIYGDDKLLKEAVYNQLQAHDWDPQKAFSKDKRFCKPSPKNGRANLVKSVKIITGPANSFVPVLKKQAVAGQSSMVRIDIFTKNNKFFIIPIYIADTVKKELPNRAIVSSKPEKEWTLIDNTFQFKYSVYPGEYLRVKTRKKEVEGYYVSTHRTTASVSLRIHDFSVKDDFTIGLKTALTVQKFQVDYLGRKFAVRQEIRHGF